MTNYNLDELLKHEHTTITIQKSKPENNDDAKLRRFKEKMIFSVGILILAILFAICIVFIFKNPANSLMVNIAFGISSGFGGYILRGK